MMIGRRQFLSVATGGVAYSGLPIALRPARAAENFCGRELFKNLPKISLDLERSITERTLVPEGGRNLEDYPGGVHLVLPSAVRIPIDKWVWRTARQSGGKRIRLMISSPDPARPVQLVATGEGEPFRVFAAEERIAALALRNLEIQGPTRGDAFRPDGLSSLWMDSVRIVGGRNCMMLPSHPTRAMIENCSFSHGGYGDGYTHNVYINYVAEIVIRNCRFFSPRRLGHALKCYAAQAWIEDSYFASYETEEDLSAGYSGELPLLDMGGWGHSMVRGNLFKRRGPVREVVIDYRNRQWHAASSSVTSGDTKKLEWGTKVAPYVQVDNRDKSSEHLFHHLLLGNRIENGVAPNGQTDYSMAFSGGSIARNNGTSPWNSHGGKDPNWLERIEDWRPHHERAILWHHGNILQGRPFEKNFLAHPYGISDLRTPVRMINQDQVSIMTRNMASKFYCI